MMHKRQLQTLVYDNFDAALTIRLNYYLNSLAIVFSMLSILIPLWIVFSTLSDQARHRISKEAI